MLHGTKLFPAHLNFKVFIFFIIQRLNYFRQFFQKIKLT